MISNYIMLHHILYHIIPYHYRILVVVVVAAVVAVVAVVFVVGGVGVGVAVVSRSRRTASTLNTKVITGLGMCKVWAVIAVVVWFILYTCPNL